MSESLCRRCYKTFYREEYEQGRAEIAAGCIYCGRKCGETICPRCLSEYKRVAEANGILPARNKSGKELRESALKVMEHMKKWASEKRGKPWNPYDAFSRPRNWDAPFKSFVEADSRFAIDAYSFAIDAVRRAKAYSREEQAEQPGPIIAHDIAHAYRELMIETFGTDALQRLVSWGVYTTGDIGAIVFRLNDTERLPIHFEGKLEDFHSIYDFASAFPTV